MAKQKGNVRVSPVCISNKHTHTHTRELNLHVQVVFNPPLDFWPPPCVRRPPLSHYYTCLHFPGGSKLLPIKKKKVISSFFFNFFF